jgi:hypothetical protein
MPNDKFPELRCFSCGEQPDRIAYYTKFYPSSNKSTIENPVLSCRKCYLSPKMKSQLMQVRGGDEKISFIHFEHIKESPKKKIGYFLSKNFFERNDLSNPYWKKVVWRIFYYMIPPKNKEGSVELPGNI